MGGDSRRQTLGGSWIAFLAVLSLLHGLKLPHLFSSLSRMPKRLLITPLRSVLSLLRKEDSVLKAYLSPTVFHFKCVSIAL